MLNDADAAAAAAAALLGRSEQQGSSMLGSCKVLSPVRARRHAKQTLGASDQVCTQARGRPLDRSVCWRPLTIQAATIRTPDYMPQPCFHYLAGPAADLCAPGAYPCAEVRQEGGQGYPDAHLYHSCCCTADAGGYQLLLSAKRSIAAVTGLVVGSRAVPSHFKFCDPKPLTAVHARHHRRDHRLHSIVAV